MSVAVGCSCCADWANLRPADDSRIGSRQLRRIMTGSSVLDGEIGDDQLGSEAARPWPSSCSSSTTAPGVNQDHVDPELGSVVHQHLEVGLGREPLGLALLRLEVEGHDPARLVLTSAFAKVRDEQVRDHAGEPRARPEDHPVSASIAASASGQAGG